MNLSDRVFPRIILLALSAVCLLAAKGPENQPHDKAVVFVKSIQASELSDLLVYPARVVSKVNTVILSETDGIISRISAPLGQSVSRGEKLMTVTHTDPVYQYAPVVVRAPVSGVVSLVEVTEGSQVTKGQRLASVTDPAQLKVTVEVPAEDVSLVAKGLAGDFQIDGRDAAISVQVSGISPFVDPATGTATCEVALIGSPNPPLAPGLIGQVTLKTNVRKGISIPDYAVFFKGRDTYVRILEDGKAKQVPVRLGKKQRGFVEILSGLSDTVSLIERTSRFIGDGEEVTVETM